MSGKTQHGVDTQALQMLHISMVVCSPVPCEGTPVIRLRGVGFGGSFCSYKF